MFRKILLHSQPRCLTRFKVQLSYVSSTVPKFRSLEMSTKITKNKPLSLGYCSPSLTVCVYPETITITFLLFTCFTAFLSLQKAPWKSLWHFNAVTVADKSCGTRNPAAISVELGCCNYKHSPAYFWCILSMAMLSVPNVTATANISYFLVKKLSKL